MSGNDLFPEDIVIELSSGTNLVANLWTPNNVNAHSKLAVCLHPWSWLGGRKDDPALDILVEPLLAENYHIVQYNSRGVGGSSGWPSFTGFTEGKDLEQVVNWAMNKLKNVQSVLIVGYSHGSLIASLFPVLPSVKTSHLLLSYPLGPRSWLTLFNSSAYTTALNQLLSHPDSNVLLVYGDRDDFTSVSRYRDWANSLTGNFRNVEIADASHFWHGRAAHKMVSAVKEWLVL